MEHTAFYKGLSFFWQSFFLSLCGSYRLAAAVAHRNTEGDNKPFHKKQTLSG